MLKFSSIMIGTSQPKVLGEFYEKVIGRKSDMNDEGWYGWTTDGVALTIGEHSEVKGEAKEPQRVILNFDVKEIEKEYERIRQIDGAKVVKELYEMEGFKGMWIATFEDPDGNYFQLMTPWEN